MDLRELKKLNKQNRKFLIMFLVSILFVIVCGYCVIKQVYFAVAWFSVPAALVALVIGCFSLNKAEKALLDYVLSQFPDWQEKSKKTNKNDYDLRDYLVSNKNIPISILPVYNNKKDLHIMDTFFYDLKNISKINYSEYEEHIRKDKNGNRTVTHKCTYEFEASMISVKNYKSLNSITYFQTNNYPPKTDKKIIEEKSKIALPKVDLPNTFEFNIDAYTNNTTVAEKLASKELFSAMQSIKEQFNLFYVKAVFCDDYIFFLLRDRYIDTFKYLFPLCIKFPWFKSIDYPLLDRAVNNFKTLTDLANQAPKLTENV